MIDPPRNRVVTQRDVATAAGVDRATVSRALDPEKRKLISPDTLERVLRVAEDLNYRTNALARGLRTQRSGIVGLEVPTSAVRTEGSFDRAMGVFVSSVEERLASHGLTTLMTFQSGPSGARERMISTGIIDGLIKMQGDGSVESSAADPGVPLVTIGFDATSNDDITIDEAQGINIAVAHLRRLGHTRIALVSEPQATVRGQRQIRTFLNALERGAEDGLRVEPAMAHFLESHPASAPESVASLLNRSSPPTGIIFTDDKAAMSGYGALRTAGLRQPDEVSVIGWGASEAGPFLIPPLTTIALPMRLAAFTTADLLVSRINGEPRPRHFRSVLKPHLLQRGSTAPPKPSASPAT